MASDPQTDVLNARAMATRAVLLNDWDPHNAAASPHASGTYDHYIPPLLEQVDTGASEEQIMDWLHARECESMCFPSLGIERLRRVARKLLAINTPDSLR